jgi:hypothetical protein
MPVVTVTEALQKDTSYINPINAFFAARPQIQADIAIKAQVDIM